MFLPKVFICPLFESWDSGLLKHIFHQKWCARLCEVVEKHTCRWKLSSQHGSTMRGCTVFTKPFQFCLCQVHPYPNQQKQWGHWSFHFKTLASKFLKQVSACMNYKKTACNVITLSLATKTERLTGAHTVTYLCSLNILFWLFFNWSWRWIINSMTFKLSLRWALQNYASLDKVQSRVNMYMQ